MTKRPQFVTEKLQKYFFQFQLQLKIQKWEKNNNNIKNLKKTISHLAREISLNHVD